MSWCYLLAAIICEIAGTMSMKLSRGFTNPAASALIFVFYAFAFTLMTLAIRKIEIGVAYTIWSGIGATLVTVIGIVCCGENVSALKLVSVALVIIGVVGLKISAG